MTQLSYVQLPDLVVADTTDVSNPVCVDDARAVSIISPSDIDGKTYTIQGNAKINATNSDTGWTTIQSESSTSTLADLAVPAVSKAASYPELGRYGSIRLKASAAVSGAVTFQCGKQVYV